MQMYLHIKAGMLMTVDCFSHPKGEFTWAVELCGGL